MDRTTSRYARHPRSVSATIIAALTGQRSAPYRQLHLAVAASLIAVLTLPSLLTFPPIVAAAPNDLELAFYWAPIHYQDTDSSDYDADYVTAIDYDSEWKTINNWEHQDDSLGRLQGKLYYSVVESPTHWFIIYAFYHPRDWHESNWFDTHENDMEGALSIVRKNGSYYGSFEGMVTVFHRDFYSYTPPGSPLTNGDEDIDGTVIMSSYGGNARPTTFQEAKGHGMKAWNGNNFPGGDGVVYYPSFTSSEVPAGGNDRDVKYQLVDIFASDGLWSRRNNSETFASWGTFRGDNGLDNAAHSPWGWDDHDDGPTYRGEIATDPAELVELYFDNLGSFSRTYTRNLYQQ